MVKSEKAANRVMESITTFITKKLGLKVNVEKSKIARPDQIKYLGFGFYKKINQNKWRPKPHIKSVEKFKYKLSQILLRKRGISLNQRLKELKYLIYGWVNYFRIGDMKYFLIKFSQWLRHKVRVVIIKQWKLPKRIYTNLMRINKALKYKFSDEDIHKVANTRLGWYRRSTGHVINFLLSPKVLGISKADRPGLVDPLNYYL